MRFETTNRSLIRLAVGESSAAAREALARLCEIYWPAVYAFVRMRGHPAASAEDLTQAYFAAFLEKEYVRDFRPELGRFRTFLRTSIGHFLANEWDRERTLKRGGGRPPISLDAATAEERLRLEPADHLTPETAFERQWVLALLSRCVERLRREREASGQGERFEKLKAFLSGDGATAGYAAVAAELGLSESAVRVAAHRLRQRFGALLREEVLQSVGDLREVDAEIRWMLEVVRGTGKEDAWRPR